MWSMILFSVATVLMLLTAQTKAVKEYVNTNIQKNKIAKMQSDQVIMKLEKKRDKIAAYTAIYKSAPANDVQLRKVSTLGAGTYNIDKKMLSNRANPIIDKIVTTKEAFSGVKFENKTLKMLPEYEVNTRATIDGFSESGTQMVGTMEHTLQQHISEQEEKVEHKIGDIVKKATRQASYDEQKSLDKFEQEVHKYMDGSFEQERKSVPSFGSGERKSYKQMESGDSDFMSRYGF